MKECAPVPEVACVVLGHPGRSSLKRLMDIVASLALLVVTLPVTLISVASIKLTSPGPVFYRQVRVGMGGRLFRVFKFRSMVVGAEQMGLGLAVAKDDDRITPVGRVLRRLSLDELPQLLNVIKGEMSLVGPRPTVPSQVEKYTEHERRRLETRPGLTGWAQVRGRNALSWKERIDLDIWYVDHWSPWLDLKILFLTIPAVLPSETKLYGETGITQDFQGRHIPK